MSFYVYENWTTESKAVIHTEICGTCKGGHECHITNPARNNGKWWGPFASYKEAKEKSGLSAPANVGPSVRMKKSQGAVCR